MSLESKNLIVERGVRSVLNLPDLVIASGQRVLLLGASGSGKTSLLSCIAGLLPPKQGTVTIDGENLYSLNKNARDRLRGQKFGFIFQTMHLLPSLTVIENITLASTLAQLPLDHAYGHKLMERLGIVHLARRKPHEISQGEQQRTALVRALVNRPKIILADEPTSALDDDNARFVTDLLLTHCQEIGAALLVATHDHRITNSFDTVISLTNKRAEDVA